MEIKVCPKCGSEDIEFIGFDVGVKDSISEGIIGGPLPTKHKCNKCGYMGSVFPIKDKEE